MIINVLGGLLPGNNDPHPRTSRGEGLRRECRSCAWKSKKRTQTKRVCEFCGPICLQCDTAEEDKKSLHEQFSEIEKPPLRRTYRHSSLPPVPQPRRKHIALLESFENLENPSQNWILPVEPNSPSVHFESDWALPSDDERLLSPQNTPKEPPVKRRKIATSFSELFQNTKHEFTWQL